MFTSDISSILLRLSAIILLSVSTTTAFQNISGRVDPDFAVRTTVDITVKPSGTDQYRTTIKKSFEYTYVSERSLEKDKFYIQESPVGTISDLEAEFNKRGLSDQRFSFEVGSTDDVFLSGSKRHTITIPVNIAKGDVFTYSYKEEIRDIVFFPLLYISSTDSITSFKTIYHLPDNTSLDLQFFFGGDSIPINIMRDDRTVTLTAGPLQEKAELPYFAYNGMHAGILTSIRIDSSDVTPASVGQMVQWYAKKTSLLPEFDSSDAFTARTLIDTAGTPLARVRSIAEYIRKNIRYIADERGLNAYIARPPSGTFKKKFGDCKDKAALGVALGRLNNIPIRMALVSTVPAAEFERPHLHLYNHVICAYDINGRTEFFDPTASNVEFGNIPDRLIGARALILDPKNPRFETIQAIVGEVEQGVAG
ncbi:MAG: transglutaminase-like domain-containing protein, partial [Bacteroidota bacterium]